jgi:protein TilB
MENLVHLKDLGYLNLALNNVQKIEGVQNCEFLHKLDLTVNFVDVDELEASMDHLATRPNLTDLYMMGNPCQANWQGFVTYVIAKLPHLKVLDGQEITKSMRIQASQKLPQLEVELRNLAEIKRNDAVEKLATIRSAKACDEIEEVFSSTVEPSETDDLGRELTDHSPEARVKVLI